jgi:hypothetical protein
MGAKPEACRFLLEQGVDSKIPDSYNMYVRILQMQFVG